VPVRAQTPEDEDRLLEPQRRLDADAREDLLVPRVPPPMPRPRGHRQLLTHPQLALFAPDQERDPAGADLEVLGAVVVDMLAARYEPTGFDREITDDASPVRLLLRLDEHDLLAGQGVPDDITCVHPANLLLRA
jgi:hypothetical protein